MEQSKALNKMRHIKSSFLLAAILAFVSMGQIQAQNKTSVVTKVTATWCPNCGTWGWDYFEALKDIYNGEEKATLLGVHHSGDLRNDVSSWFANNLNFFYQPEFFHNNADLNVTRNNWQDKVDELSDLIDDYNSESPAVLLGFVNAYTENGDLVCTLNFDASAKADGDHYIAIYIFENNVENVQSTRGMSLHPNVLRDVMNEEYFGDLFTGEDATGNTVFQKEYRKPLNPDWNPDNVGLLAILWQEDNGQYVAQNASAIHNVGLLSATQEVLNDDKVNIRYSTNGFDVRLDDSETYKLSFMNSNAQLLHMTEFSERSFIETTQFPSGIYTIHLQNKNSVYTQQVIIAR